MKHTKEFRQQIENYFAEFIRMPGKYIGYFLVAAGIFYSFGAIGNDDMLFEMGIRGSIFMLMLKTVAGVAVAMAGNALSRYSVRKHSVRAKIVPISSGTRPAQVKNVR